MLKMVKDKSSKTGAGDILQAKRTQGGLDLEHKLKQGMAGMFADSDSDSESDTPMDPRSSRKAQTTIVAKNKNRKNNIRGKQSTQRDSQQS